MLSYLRQLHPSRVVLWCYLIWYLGVLARYFDPSLALWGSSLGIGAIIGTALYLSTVYAGAQKTTLGRWQIIRLYMMPFCVSSFAALIKGKGFVLVFYPDLRGNLIAASFCASFVTVVLVAKWATSRAARSLEAQVPEARSAI